jgi:hypothetical protein
MKTPELIDCSPQEQKLFIVPEAALRCTRFKRGQELEVKASGGVITILPKLPTADDEYTREQRRIIDAQLAKGLADIRAGRIRGPFSTHTKNSLILFIKKQNASAARKLRARLDESSSTTS